MWSTARNSWHIWAASSATNAVKISCIRSVSIFETIRNHQTPTHHRFVKLLPSFRSDDNLLTIFLSKNVVTASPSLSSTRTTTTTTTQWNHQAKALWFDLWNPVHGQISTQNEVFWKEKSAAVISSAAYGPTWGMDWSAQSKVQSSSKQSDSISKEVILIVKQSSKLNHCGNRPVLLTCCSWYLIWFSTSWGAFQDTIMLGLVR